MVRSLKTLYWCDSGDTDIGDGPDSVEMLLKSEKVCELAGLNFIRQDVTFDDVFTWKRLTTSYSWARKSPSRYKMF